MTSLKFRMQKILLLEIYYSGSEENRTHSDCLHVETGLRLRSISDIDQVFLCVIVNLIKYQLYLSVTFLRLFYAGGDKHRAHLA